MTATPSSSRLVLKNAGWTAAGMGVSIVTGIVQMGLLARMLGPAALGVLGLFISCTALAGSLLRLSNAEAAITFVSRAIAGGRLAEAGRTIGFCYLVDLLSGLFAWAVLALLGGIVAPRVGIPEAYGGLLTVYSLTLVPLAPFWTSHALLRVADRFKWTFLQANLHAVLGLAGAAFLYFERAGLGSVVLLYLALAVFDGVSIVLLARTALHAKGIRVSLHPRGLARAPEGFWGFAGAGYGKALVKSVSRYADTLMLGAWATPVQVGLYRAVKQISDQLQLPAQGLVSSLYPEYSRLWFAGRVNALRRLATRAVLGLFAVSVVMGVMMWSFSDLVIARLLGPQFAGARNPLLVMVLATAVNIVVTPLYSILPAIGRPGAAFGSSLVALAAQVAFLWYFVPRLGALGAAYGALLAVLIWGAWLVRVVSRLLRDGNEAVSPAAPLPEAPAVPSGLRAPGLTHSRGGHAVRE